MRNVVVHSTTRPEIHTTGDKIPSHVLVPAVGISASWADAVVLGIPVRMGIAFIVPAPVIAVVMPVAAIVPVAVVLFVPILIVLLATVTMVVAVLPRCGDGQGSCQSHEQCSRNDFSHRASLQKIRCWPTLTPPSNLCRFGFSQAVSAFSHYAP